MRHDEFLAKCRNIDPSAEIDRAKNLEHIKLRLIEEEEKLIMIKPNRLKKPSVVAAALVAVLSLSVVAYAAAPAIWRHFDTGVVQGEEFVTDFFVAEIDMPDGTTSVGMGIDVDREAHQAAGGGVIILEVDGEEWVYLDELHFDNLDDGLALLQIDNLLLPGYLPQGFAFDRLTFPVNPNYHTYRLGTLPAAENAFIYFRNGDSSIQMQVGSWDSNVGISAHPEFGQQALFINGSKAVIMTGSLTESELSRLEGVELYNDSTNWDNYDGMFGGGSEPGVSTVTILTDNIMYSFRSADVKHYELVKMVASMK